jgi:hypothetical protein
MARCFLVSAASAEMVTDLVSEKVCSYDIRGPV